MWQVLQTRRFARQYKKLQDNTAADADAAVLTVQPDPHAAPLKKGDLAGLRVHKFSSAGQLYLLGYTLDDGIHLIYLEAVGPYENFYRDVKR
jgi:mRNA-degrading endonuclease RelE of RelBE toxin-antitoxin system